MTQLTKVSAKPEHLSEEDWKIRLLSACSVAQPEDIIHNLPNLYAVIFFDFTTSKFVTTIIFNEDCNRDALNAITRGFESLHNTLNKPA